MTKCSQINYNTFLNTIKNKKQYINTLKHKIFLLNNVNKKNPKNLNLFTKTFFSTLATFNDNIVMYILDISFLETNTFLHVMSPNGKLIFFCSAGSLNYKGKQKKLRFIIFQDLFKMLVSKLTFLKKKPIALHLKNVDSNKFWILKKLKKKFYIKVIRNFSLYPHNGCRKKKMQRKKNAIKIKKKWLSGLKRQIVNLLSFLIVGSNPSFFKNKFYVLTKYNAAVACLLWEQEGMCSNHIISKYSNFNLKIYNVFF